MRMVKWRSLPSFARESSLLQMSPPLLNHAIWMPGLQVEACTRWGWEAWVERRLNCSQPAPHPICRGRRDCHGRACYRRSCRPSRSYLSIAPAEQPASPPQPTLLPLAMLPQLAPASEMTKTNSEATHVSFCGNSQKRQILQRDSCILPPLHSTLSPCYTLELIWSPSCKNSLIDENSSECYTCQDQRFYCSHQYEDE
jgi:hypothetical protein